MPSGEHIDVIRRRARVTGRVQGVGFREMCRREASRLGLVGSVRNLPDGGVAVVFEGPSGSVEQMLTWCRRGPRMAHVRDVDVVAEAPTGATGFTIDY